MTFDLTPSKSWYLIINSNRRLTIKCRVELEVISDSFRMLELSNAQHVNVCHYLKFFVNEFDVIDISKAYDVNHMLGLDTVGARLHHWEGTRVFTVTSSVVASSFCAHVWLV